MTQPDIRSIQRILALSVETLIRNGNAAEADEAIHQGRAVAERLGPFAPDRDENEAQRHVEIRRAVLADAGILDAPRPIKLEH